MPARRVLLLSNGSLFMTSVLRLLQRVEGLELEWVDADDREASRKIGSLAPQVIVLDAGGDPSARQLLTWMLPELPGVRIITLSLERADIGVIRTERGSEASLNGLLEAIQGRRRSRTRRRAVSPLAPKATERTESAEVMPSTPAVKI